MLVNKKTDNKDFRVGQIMETEPERVWQNGILFGWGTFNTTRPQTKQNNKAHNAKGNYIKVY